jgi:hypothetical protein
MNWIDLAQNGDQWGALINTVTNLRVPKKAGKFLSHFFDGESLNKSQVEVKLL